MKAIIFAGGVGTRLWPLSRKKSPKQFEKLIGDKSTLQLTVERLLPEFKPKDIFISTGVAYKEIIFLQLPFVPKENIIAEPSKKDVGPAVAFVTGYIAKKFGPGEPIFILWSDHIVKKETVFKRILQTAETVIKRDSSKIVFIGQKPRFASDNLGWIEFNKKVKEENGVSIFAFNGFKYKPDKKLAAKYYSDKKHCWNLGYFVTTPSFILNAFKRFTPQIHEYVMRILQDIEKPSFAKTFTDYYDKMPVINFDNAILEQLDKNAAYVIVEDIGWSDIGAWESLKEALEKQRTDNITHGRVLLEGSVDSLVYNYEHKKIIVGIDLNDLLVVNTDDVLLVTKKSSVSKIKTLVESFQGTENEELT